MSLLGFYDGAGTLIGVATIVADFIVEHVWHIGLFIVATALHGSGVAASLYAWLERSMIDQGARWLRLGVVHGSAQAEKFWLRCGYVQVRERGPVTMGRKSNLLRVDGQAARGRNDRRVPGAGRARSARGRLEAPTPSRLFAPSVSRRIDGSASSSCSRSRAIYTWI